MEVPVISPDVVAETAISSYKVNEQVSKVFQSQEIPQSELRSRLHHAISRGFVESDSSERPNSVATILDAAGKRGIQYSTSEKLDIFARTHDRKAEIFEQLAERDVILGKVYKSQADEERSAAIDLRTMQDNLDGKKVEVEGPDDSQIRDGEFTQGKIEPSSPENPQIVREKIDSVRREMQEEVQSQEIKEIIASVVDTTIFGKFPNGARLERVIDGGVKKSILETDSAGWKDYVFDSGYTKFPLDAVNNTALFPGINIQSLLHDVSMYRSRFNPSIGSKTQFLIGSKFTPNEQAGFTSRYPEAVKYQDGYVVVSYVFDQVGADAAGRPLIEVAIHSLMPNEQYRKLLKVLDDNPDMIEQYYSGVAPGFDMCKADDGTPLVKRVKSDELVGIDTTGFNQQALEVADKFGLAGFAECFIPMVNALEILGRIDHWQYKEDKHGSFSPGELSYLLDAGRRYNEIGSSDEARAVFRDGMNRIQEYAARSRMG